MALGVSVRAVPAAAKPGPVPCINYRADTANKGADVDKPRMLMPWIATRGDVCAFVSQCERSRSSLTLKSLQMPPSYTTERGTQESNSITTPYWLPARGRGNDLVLGIYMLGPRYQSARTDCQCSSGAPSCALCRVSSIAVWTDDSPQFWHHFCQHNAAHVPLHIAQCWPNIS
jgi:hypothetical protein